MLTQEQIEKLEPLTKHPRYGKILKDAMVNWMLPNVSPRMLRDVWGVLGVTWINDRYVINGNFCDLIDGFVANKQNIDPNYRKDIIPWCEDIAMQYAEVTFVEIRMLNEGFEQIIGISSLEFPEAYDFGKQVSIAIFGDVNAQ